MGFVYLTNCVNSDGRSINNMKDSSVSVSRRTFVQRVGREVLAEVEQKLGYAKHYKQGFTMAGDWHVSYSRSKYRGRLCYYFTWSAIEYIFVKVQHGEKTGDQSVQRVAS